MNAPRAMAVDDKANLADLFDVEQAMIEAHQALTRAMVGHGPHERENFVYYVGVARGRLSRVINRIYGQDQQLQDTTGESDP